MKGLPLAFLLLWLLCAHAPNCAVAGESSESNDLPSVAIRKRPAPATSQWAKAVHAIDFIAKLSGIGFHGKPVPAKLSVIGAGFARTGTKSFAEAMSLIGHKVYDIRVILQHKHDPLWIEAARAWNEDDNLEPMELLIQGIEKLGYSVTMDTPLGHLAPALMKLRPDAKVIWTYLEGKDFDQWYRSFGFVGDMGCYLQSSRPWSWIFPEFMTFVDNVLAAVASYNLKFCSRELMNVRASPWHDEFRPQAGPMWTSESFREEWRTFWETFPAELKKAAEEEVASGRPMRYFEYSVTQGWVPLLDMLDVPKEKREELLQQPFPHVNERVTLNSVWSFLRFTAAIWPFWLALKLIFVLYIVRRLCCLPFSQISKGSFKKTV